MYLTLLHRIAIAKVTINPYLIHSHLFNFIKKIECVNSAINLASILRILFFNYTVSRLVSFEITAKHSRRYKRKTTLRRFYYYFFIYNLIMQKNFLFKFKQIHLIKSFIFTYSQN